MTTLDDFAPDRTFVLASRAAEVPVVQSGRPRWRLIVSRSRAIRPVAVSDAYLGRLPGPGERFYATVHNNGGPWWFLTHRDMLTLPAKGKTGYKIEANRDFTEENLLEGAGIVMSVFMEKIDDGADPRFVEASGDDWRPRLFEVLPSTKKGNCNELDPHIWGTGGICAKCGRYKRTTTHYVQKCVSDGLIEPFAIHYSLKNMGDTHPWRVGHFHLTAAGQTLFAPPNRTISGQDGTLFAPPNRTIEAALDNY